MIKTLTYNQIDPQQWQALIDRSPYATWFQTPEAYEFYASNPEEMMPFAVGIEEDGHLVGVIVGYTTQEKNPIKQLLTCRSIIIGGPLLDEHISSDALMALLVAVKQVAKKAIYVETRNFNDYSNWKGIFEQCGFQYHPHLNFHVDTTQPWETIENNIGKHRRKYIRLSYRDGVEVELEPTLQQVKEYYTVLQDLYRTKVKMPLQPWSFFERLYHMRSCKYLLVLYNNQVVGGSICMTLKGHGVYEWYACGKDGMFRNIYPSSVTKHIGMKYASDNGYEVFDMMGAGKPNEAYGVRDFKAEFGGKLVEHGRFLCIRKRLLYWTGKTGVKILKRK
jgi:lipid II:glycine glycyltransferase (peptidoglycan interpeptide bridge formation enzyme)